MDSITQAPILIIVPLLAAAFLIPPLHKHERLITILFLAAGGASLIGAINLAVVVLRTGTVIYNMGAWMPPHGIELVADAFAAYSSLVFAGVALPVFWFAVVAKQEAKSLSGYLTLLLLLTASLHGMVLTGDIFNLFVFIEISSLAATAIIAIKGTRDSIEATFRYLVMSALGSGGILFAIALIFMISGHLNMAYVREALSLTAAHYPLNVLTALAFLLVGFGVKAALFPLHVWLPDAHSNAPTPSSALLSGLVVKAYIVAFMRLTYLAFGLDIINVLPIRTIFLVLSSFAIIGGSIMAMAQDELKRMLAFSTVAQVGYIFLGFGLFTERAIQGGVLHILNHALMKSVLFLCAGIIIQQTGIKRIEQLEGLGRRMPVTFGAFTVGALSMVGIPGFAGFISKLYLGLGALDGGRVIFVLVILLSSLLNAGYYFPIIISAFFPQRKGPEDSKEPAWKVLAPVVFLASMVVFLGLFPSVAVPLLRETAQLFK